MNTSIGAVSNIVDYFANGLERVAAQLGWCPDGKALFEDLITEGEILEELNQGRS